LFFSGAPRLRGRFVFFDPRSSALIRGKRLPFRSPDRCVPMRITSGMVFRFLYLRLSALICGKSFTFALLRVSVPPW
jgi:hypothetical protein